MRTAVLLSVVAWLAAVPFAEAPRAQAPPAVAPRGSKTPAPPTPEQLQRVSDGVTLQDQGKYDESIAIFEGVLSENPECVPAIAELANSYLGKKEFAKAIEIATSGLVYASPNSAMLYDALGSAYDDIGNAAKAIETYKEGIAVSPHGLLYFNLAQTYLRQRNDIDALANLKQAAFAIPNHSNTQLELARHFQRHGYLSQALLAYSRFLILEPTSDRAEEAFRTWISGWFGGARLDADGQVKVATRPPADTAEGDFTKMDETVALSRGVALGTAAGKPEAQQLVVQLDRWITRLAAPDQPGDRAAFAWRYYAPYFVELQRRGYVEPFAYWASQGINMPGVKEWVADPANRQRAAEFVRWSQQYQWPKE